MKALRLLSFLLATIHSFVAHPQQDSFPPACGLLPLTPSEVIRLKNLPVLTIPEGFTRSNLPYAVDNSTQPYMRPVFNQDAYCCGQAAGIAYNYTYEIDRARNLPANVTDNQYPTHFSWNFMNGGNGWYGVSYLHSFGILKHYGSPTVTDYGGTPHFGGGKRWMSGYTEYFNGMHNRINGVKQIQAGDEEGLSTLREWIHNHLDGSGVGGVASFYAQYMAATNQLPAGTPEEGKYVLTYFGGSPNHAMTIVGYNDSIRWDYNNDGQYTNHLDINSDGLVNMKDWEIGGLKMVQSYGGVPNWGDQGYAYMMYKTLADDLGEGGIWNHSVHVLDVKTDFGPRLTAKIILKHDRRNQVKVITGLSNDIAASIPEFRLGFPIFDYQGGNNYLQGGTSEEDKTIEFGLDLSPLLTHAELGQQVKVFLEVSEQDPQGQGTGEIVFFSVFDHTGDYPVEVICSQTNIPLVNNDTTRASLFHTFSFDRVEIQDEILPPIAQGQPYSHQMTATGGTSPYVWEFDRKYPESVSTESFPLADEELLVPTNNYDGLVTRTIDFAFPFYDSSYTDITLHVDGYIMFDEQLYPYPYFNDPKVLFSITRNISPFLYHDQVIYPALGDGLWYEGDETIACFRWKTSLDGFGSGTEFNYAVKLYPSGKIEFYYGQVENMGSTLWLSGISEGDDENNQLTTFSNKSSLTPGTRIVLNKYDLPGEFTLSPEGLLTGIPQQSYASVEMNFKVTDHHFIKDYKTLTLTASGILVQDSISSGGDNIIDYDETTLMSVSVVNLEDFTIQGAIMEIDINDPHITLTDSTEELGELTPGAINRFEDAFEFVVSPEIPNEHLITVNTAITGNDTTWESSLFLTAFAPDIRITGTEVDDENARPDPGDTAIILVSFRNDGGSGASNIFTLLDTDDTLIEILDNFHLFLMLEPGEEETASFSAAISPETHNGHQVLFFAEMTGDNSFSASDTFNLVVGFDREDFETGNFSMIHWGHSGSRDWLIDPAISYEGDYSARSGYITDNQHSSLFIDMDLYEDGEISFFRKVSCEEDTVNTGYDYLSFLVDGIEHDRWDGEKSWDQRSYPVDEGFHRFEWRYVKDGSVSRGMDGAWIDLVSFTPLEEATPLLQFTPAEIELLMRPDEEETIQVGLFNTGPGEQEYELYVSSLGDQDLPGGSRNILGTFIVSSHNTFNTNEMYEWEMKIYNTSPDNEWIRDVYIDFPPGIELIDTQDFTGGSGGPLVFQGPTGNGARAHWHGDDGSGWGVLKGGETAEAKMAVNVHEINGQDVTVPYEAHGDINGTEPHVAEGELEFLNLGDSVSWLSVTDTSCNILQGDESRMIDLHVSTSGMEDGSYACELLIFDSFCDANKIAVTLVVDETLGEESIARPDPGSLEIFPNPTGGKIWLSFFPDKTGPHCLTVSRLDGTVIVKKMIEAAHRGKQVVPVDLSANGAGLQNGIYILQIVSGSGRFTGKVAVINSKNK